MIKGIEKLTEKQIEHMERVNKHHTDCVGLDYKAGMEIIEAWVDERDNVCVRPVSYTHLGRSLFQFCREASQGLHTGTLRLVLLMLFVRGLWM